MKKQVNPIEKFKPLREDGKVLNNIISKYVLK